MYIYYNDNDDIVMMAPTLKDNIDCSWILYTNDKHGKRIRRKSKSNESFAGFDFEEIEYNVDNVYCSMKRKSNKLEFFIQEDYIYYIPKYIEIMIFKYNNFHFLGSRKFIDTWELKSNLYTCLEYDFHVFDKNICKFKTIENEHFIIGDNTNADSN